MAVAVNTKKGKTLSFPRRFFMALCIAGIVVTAYYLFYHEPTLKRIDEIEKSMARQRETVARADQEWETVSRRIDDHKIENLELEREIAALRAETDVGEIDVKHSISDAVSRYGNLALSFDTGQDSTTREPRSTKDNKASFSVQGSFQDMMAFLKAIPNLKGIPHDWALVFREYEDCLDLWMEMEFTK